MNLLKSAVLLLGIAVCGCTLHEEAPPPAPGELAAQAASFTAYWETAAHNFRPDFDAGDIKDRPGNVRIDGKKLDPVPNPGGTVYLTVPGEKYPPFAHTGAPHAALWRSRDGMFYVIVSQGCIGRVATAAYGPFVQENGGWRHK